MPLKVGKYPRWEVVLSFGNYRRQHGDPLEIEDIVIQLHGFCENVRHCEPLRVQIGSRAPQHCPIVQCGGLGSTSSGGNKHYTKEILQEETELEELIETSTNPIWTAKGGATKTFITISSPENRGDVDKSSTRLKIISRGKEGAVATDPIHFNEGGNEDKHEVDVDPYALPASPNIQQKPQLVTKMVSLF